MRKNCEEEGSLLPLDMHNPFSKIVREELDKFLNKVFFFSKRGNNFCEEVVLAAASHSYVETVEGKADSLHLKIKQCEWEDFLEVYKNMIGLYVRSLNVRAAILAFDITSDPFYGKTSNFYTIGCENNEGYSQQFEYLVMSLANEKCEEKIPLACIPVHAGFDTAKAIRELLAFASTLFRVRFVLLDRGFYSVETIRMLEESGYKYLMLMPKRSEEIKYLADTVFDAGYTMYTMTSGLGEHFTIRVVFIRDESDKFTWTFATNMIFDDYNMYLYFYKKRWRIETGFRVEDEAKIKSKSIYPIVRYFYFLTSLLLHTLWLVFQREIPFKRFLIRTSKFLMLESLGITTINMDS